MAIRRFVQLIQLNVQNQNLFGVSEQLGATSSPTVTIEILETPVELISLSIAVDKITGYVGDIFTFTGKFTRDGTGIRLTLVKLYKDSTDTGGSAYTDIDGNYTIKWIADAVGIVTMHTEALAPVV